MLVDGDTISYVWGPLRIAPALPHDLPLVTAILDEAAARLRRAGINQWEPGTWPTDRMQQQTRAGEVYIAWFGTEAAATFTLQWADEAFWGAQPEDAGYIHRLALPDRWVGVGLGRALLEWAEGAVRAADREYLRLDCMAANPGIRRYYEALGFVCCGEIESPRWQAALYEKRVTGEHEGHAPS